MSNPLGRILRNSAWGIVGLFFGAPLNFAVTILLARGLGTKGFGAFEAIFVYCSVFQILAEGGLSTVLVRRIATNQEWARTYLGQAKGLIWALSGAGFLAGTLFATWRAPLHFLLPAVILLAATLLVIHAMIHVAVFRAFEEMGWNAAGFILQKGLNVLLILVLVWGLDLGVLGAAVSLFVANLSLLVFYSAALRKRHFPNVRPVYDLGAWWSLIREAMMLGLGRTLRKITWQVDSLLLPLMAGIGATGVYRAAYKPLNFFNWIPFVVAIPLFPHISRLAETDREELVRTYQKALKFMAIISLPTAAGLTALAEPLLLLIYGPQYEGAVPAFRVLVWSINFLFLTSVFPFLFAALRANRFYAYIMGLGLGVNLVLDLVLIPSMGIMGACWGTLAAEALMYLCGWAGFRRIGFHVPLIRGLAGPAALAVAAGGGLWSVRGLPIVLLIPALLATAVLYVLALWVTGIVTRSELASLRRAVGRRGDRGDIGASAVDRELVDTGSGPR